MRGLLSGILLWLLGSIVLWALLLTVRLRIPPLGFIRINSSLFFHLLIHSSLARVFNSSLAKVPFVLAVSSHSSYSLSYLLIVLLRLPAQCFRASLFSLGLLLFPMFYDH